MMVSVENNGKETIRVSGHVAKLFFQSDETDITGKL